MNTGRQKTPNDQPTPIKDTMSKENQETETTAANKALPSSSGSQTDTERLDWLMSHDDGDVVLEMVNREMIDTYMKSEENSKDCHE